MLDQKNIYEMDFVWQLCEFTLTPKLKLLKFEQIKFHILYGW